MATALSQIDEREQRLQEILLAYLEAVEAGQTPDRQALLDRHADLAAELREFFAEQDKLDRWTEPLRAVAAAARGGVTPNVACQPTVNDADVPAEAAARSLGDYELLELIGRGGMGIVYRVRQKSLNRIVALKMVRAADLASVAEVQRFRNEAEIVASLDHPHVVPIHEVGEAEGQLYFSMKLMEGGTLAERLPDFGADPRSAARLVADVARAVHHAHQRGVLHRDLKPSNILLDAEGRPHVSDFGLAKRVEADDSLTQSGVLVGTPGYMAPEQTAGKKGAVTTATDVYGLGAILYALLTGRPPFQGQTVLETLGQVNEREPEPPSRSNRRVDRDLETICLKCLEKEPHRRYESAQGLVQDLERYLAGEPVQARRAGPSERFRKWVRRRPALVALVVVTVLAGVGLVAGLVGHNAQLSAAATREHDQAEHARTERDAAREQKRQARKAVDDMYTEVAQKWLGQQPRLTELQRDFLLKALRYYQDFVRDEDADADARRDKATAYVHVAEIQRKLGQFDEAASAYRQAIALWEQLAAEFPAVPEYLRDIALARGSLAKPLYEKGRFKESLEAFQQALSVHEQLAVKFPDEPIYRRDLAANCLSVSIVLWRRQQYGEAEKLLRRSLELFKELADRFPDDPQHRADLTLAYNQQGNLLNSHGRPDEAATAYRQAAALAEKLVAEFPTEPKYGAYLTLNYNNPTKILLATQQLDEAGKVNRRALKLAEGLVADFPAVREHRMDLARCHQWAAELLRAGGHFQKALEESRQAVRACPDHALLLNDVAWFLASCLDPQFREPAWALELADKAVQTLPEHSRAYSARALAHYRMGDWKAVLADLEKARQLRGADVGSADCFILAMTHWQLGDKEQGRQLYDQAITWMDKTRSQDEGLRRFRAEAAALLGIKEAPALDKEVAPQKDK